MTVDKSRIDPEITTDSPPPETVPGPAGDSGSGVPAREIGGPRGKEPTRYGDWEINGRCTDF